MGVKVNRKKWIGILGGDLLASEAFRRQIPLMVLITVLVIFYIQNRYAFQTELIELDRLNKELTDVRYDALTRNSELMEQSRQSKIEEYILRSGSKLEISSAPPYLIKNR